ncbi:hypothetical protein QW180_08515 [Vibrio sinaloensis]|nr:hypothetical protein [Vibrio sinaloensis]
MEVVFRVDASTEMGSGHVMRCLVLAEALRKRQAQVTFACLPLEGNLIELIQSKGFQVVTLPALDAQAAHQGDSEYSKWLPHSQKQDAAFFPI